jgi:hypothetical protein
MYIDSLSATNSTSLLEDINIFKFYLKCENLTIESGEISQSTGCRRRICFSYNQNVKNMLKLLISVVNGCQKEIGVNSLADI